MGPLVAALLRGLLVGAGALITVLSVMDAGFWLGAAITGAAFLATVVVSFFQGKKKGQA